MNQQHKRIVEAFKAHVCSVWFDDPSDAEGRRGQRYSFELDLTDSKTVEFAQRIAEKIREDMPDFAWNFFAEGDLNAWPRTKLWQRLDNEMVRGPQLIDVVSTCWMTYQDIDEVVAITSSPDLVVAGEVAHVSIVLRISMGPPPADLLKVINDRRVESLNPAWELQAASELNFPPTSQNRPNEEKWLELKGEVMRIVEPYRMVVAVWFHDEGGDRPYVYVYGEDDSRLDAALRAVKVTPIYVTRLSEVPREAGCLFNQVTRLVKAEAEGDQTTLNRIREGIKEAAAKNTQAPLPSGYVRCRWCKHSIPSSQHPDYVERCPACSAIQPATTIPTKSKEMPLISLFVNPDGSAYVECVFRPDVPNRWDLSPVRRYTVPASWAQEFASHPMGKKNP